MAKYSVKEITNKKEWEKFILSNNPQTFLQSWNWGEINKEMGAKIFRLGFLKDSKLVGASLVIREDARRGPHLIIPAGPIIDWKDNHLIHIFIKTIHELGIKEKAWFVRVRPEIYETLENRELFKKLGFVSAPMHLHAENTWVLDIGGSEESILAGMRKTTRYLVRKAMKSGLCLEISKDPKYSHILFELQKETAARHGFVGFSEKLFNTEIAKFVADNQAAVFVCRDGKEVLAEAIIIFYGDTAYYHFSGSVSGHSNMPFSYLLQWEVIKEAKKRGIHYYNFWGIAPNDDPKHRFAGVTLFKTGFGGQHIDWLHAHDLPISKMYWITYVFETLRRKIRHL